MDKPTHPMRVWRKANGKTLQEMADAVGVTQSHLSEIENWNNEPSLVLASKLRNKTGIDMSAFIKKEAAQ